MKVNNLLVFPSRTPIMREESETTPSTEKKISEVLEFPNQRKVVIDCLTRDVLFEKGLAAERLGNVGEAAMFYNQAVGVDPDTAGAWVNLGTIAFHRRDLEDAERCYRKAVEVDPHYSLAQYNLGNCLHGCGKIEEAENCYLRALKIHPMYLDAHYNLALLYQESGKPQQAAKHWMAYTKGSPEGDPHLHIVKSELAKLEKTYGDNLASAMKLFLVE